MFSLTSAQFNSKWTRHWGIFLCRNKCFHLELVSWSAYLFIHVFGRNNGRRVSGDTCRCDRVDHVDQGCLTCVLGSLVFVSGGWDRRSLDPRRPSSQAFTCFGSFRFIAWCLRRPFVGECRWSQGIFCTCRAFELLLVFCSHYKKALCHTLSWCGDRQIPTRPTTGYTNTRQKFSLATTTHTGSDINMLTPN